MNAIQQAPFTRFDYSFATNGVFFLTITLIALVAIALIAMQGSAFKSVIQSWVIIKGTFLGYSLFLMGAAAFFAFLNRGARREVANNLQEDSYPFRLPSIELNEAILLEEAFPQESLETPPQNLQTGPRVDPLEVLPKDISLTVFSYLNMRDILSCCLVSKKWKSVASTDTIWKNLSLDGFGRLDVFDEKDWKSIFKDLSSFGIDVQVPKVDKRTLRKPLKNFLSSFKKIYPFSFATLLTVPKGLTLNKLVMISSISDLTFFRDPLWNAEVSKTYQVLITHDILPNSSDLSSDKQKELMEKSGCQMPEIIEAAALMVIRRSTFSRTLCHRGRNHQCALRDGFHTLFAVEDPPADNYGFVGRWRFNIVGDYIINI